jgi:hypothetical protein
VFGQQIQHRGADRRVQFVAMTPPHQTSQEKRLRILKPESNLSAIRNANVSWRFR